MNLDFWTARLRFRNDKYALQLIDDQRMAMAALMEHAIRKGHGWFDIYID